VIPAPTPHASFIAETVTVVPADALLVAEAPRARAGDRLMLDGVES
jgi:hypothetical protein